MLCHDKVQCIERRYWCDGLNNGHYGCHDGSDEGPHCTNYDCILDYKNPGWKCADNLQCLSAYYVCDGRKHHQTPVATYTYGCRDKSDEHNKLCGYCTGDDEWPCQDGDGCAHRALVCDGVPSCNDHSDENKDVCLAWNCTKGMWKCHDNRLCIPRSSICDGEIHCIDHSDEMDCLTYTCLENARKCANNEECVEIEAICDGKIDCLDGSDEMCSASCLQTPLDVKTIVARCTEDSTRCFPVERYCDRMPDCIYGSDEDDLYCTCEDWDMSTCKVGDKELCIYQEWVDIKSGKLCNMDGIILNANDRNLKQLNLSG